MSGRCAVNRDCKVKVINNYLATKESTQLTQYIGIAIDEPKRLERLDANKVSLLAKYNYTEAMARAKAEEYGLLSPTYQYSQRGGCWFCPNASIQELKHLRSNYKELWDELLRLEEIPDIIGDMWNIQKRISIHQMDERLYWEDAQMTIALDDLL